MNSLLNKEALYSYTYIHRRKWIPSPYRFNQECPASFAPFAHSFASISELLPPRRLVDMINTFFAIINQLRFLQKISGFYQMGLHPGYRKDLYEQPLELLAALYWMCTCCP